MASLLGGHFHEGQHRALRPSCARTIVRPLVAVADASLLLDCVMNQADSHTDEVRTSRERMLACLVVVIGTLSTMVSIDLVLPAIPTLPSLLGGDPQAAQYVLATYMGGSSIG